MGGAARATRRELHGGGRGNLVVARAGRPTWSWASLQVEDEQWNLFLKLREVKLEKKKNLVGHGILRAYFQCLVDEFKTLKRFCVTFTALRLQFKESPRVALSERQI
jgi:hypothetical protein